MALVADQEPPPYKVWACRPDRGRVAVDPMWQRGVWAVTRKLGLDGGVHDDIWTVTHLPSGGALKGINEPLRRAIGLGLLLWRRIPEHAADQEWGSARTFGIPRDVASEAREWLRAARSSQPPDGTA